MTINSFHVDAREVDFFSLDSRKKKQIDVEMLDYDYVEKCSDLDELKGILALLRSGKEGRYPHLEKTVEDKILSVLPSKERKKIILMRSGPSSNEVSSETDELTAWSQVIDEKHKAISSKKSGKKFIPPVRGQQVIYKVKEPQEGSSPIEKKEKKAIPAYDFRAWEKYDVDKALDELDQEELNRQQKVKNEQELQKMREKQRQTELASLPSYIDLDALSKEEREIYAMHEKQKGNECFKAGENEDALLYYTRSIAFDDTSAIVYSNRALTHLRLKNFSLAEQDCTSAIHYDPLYVKAWTRRGMTRFRRGKYSEALEDFKQALVLEPDSKEIKKLLVKTQEKWKEVDGTVELQDIQRNQPVQFSQQENETPLEKPFKRFEIIESDDEDDDPTDTRGDDRTF
jgi:tetratricopeptide (TPR) repeat protein